MTQGDLASAPLASSSLTVQPQSFEAVISAARDERRRRFQADPTVVGLPLFVWS